MKRSGTLRRTTPLRRKTKLRARNPERRQSEFRRCYHSRERVRFIKAMPCTYCVAVMPLLRFADHAPSDNAHTVVPGKGMKGGYETIVPLCRNHHRKFDEYKAPFDEERIREALRKAAAIVELKWQEHVARTCANLSLS